MNQYHFSRYLYKPKKRKRKIFIILFLFLALGGGVFYSIFFLDIYSLYVRIVDLYRIVFNDYTFLEKQLQSGNYNVVIHEGEPYLDKRPLNPRLLRYLGESYYYISGSLAGTEKDESLNRAIIYLRKGLVLSRFEDIRAKNYFILGMAYFKKGPLYYELAAEYLKTALEKGYSDNSMYEVLGFCYYKLGVPERAIQYLEKAKALTRKDIVSLYLALSYKDHGLFESAVKELEYLIKNTQDQTILEEAYSIIAWIDFQEERYDEAAQNLNQVLILNPDSAYAHFWLGNIYEKKGDLISARKEWRTTLKIDPKHIGAIEKLY